MAKLTLSSQPAVTADTFEITEIRLDGNQVRCTAITTFSDGSRKETVQIMPFDRWPDVKAAFDALEAKVRDAHAWQDDRIADHGQAYTPPPPVPSVAAAATSVTASWEAVPGANAYRVYKSTDQGATWSAPVEVVDTTKQVSGLTADTDYTVAVSAVGSGGEGPKASVPVRTAAQ
jgi:hypothetical protein